MATQEDMKKTWNGESRGYEEDVEGRIKRIGRKRGMANQEDIKKKWNTIVATIVVSCVLEQEAVYIAKWHKRTLTLLCL